MIQGDSQHSKSKLAGTLDKTVLGVVSSEFVVPPIPNNVGAPVLNRLVLFVVI